MKKLILLIISVLFLMSCDIHPDDPELLNNDEHAIISAVLDSLMQLSIPESINIYDQTSTLINCASLNIAFERDSIHADSLIKNYYDSNRIPYSLNIDKLPDYVVLKDTEESDPFSGYIAFSRPAICNNGLFALVEYHSMSAPFAGSGTAVVLEKQNHKWIIIWQDIMWIC